MGRTATTRFVRTNTPRVTERWLVVDTESLRSAAPMTVAGYARCAPDVGIGDLVGACDASG